MMKKLEILIKKELEGQKIDLDKFIEYIHNNKGIRK